MVSGYLRYIGAATVEGYMPVIEPIAADAVWGRKHNPSKTIDQLPSASDIRKKKSNRSASRGRLSDDLKAEVARLYQREGKKVDEIAKELKLHPRKISSFCMMLAGFDVPPGEITVRMESGREITVYPPGYARGADPQRNVRVRDF